MNNSLKYFAFSMLLVAMAGCVEDSITQAVGILPDETSMNSVGGQLYSIKTFSNEITIDMYEGDKATTDIISYALTKPATAAVTVKVVPDPTLVSEYNKKSDVTMFPFPTTNVIIGEDGVLTVPAGKTVSGSIGIALSSEGLESEKNYLLAIALAQKPAEVEDQTTKQVIYYKVSFQKKKTTFEQSGQLIEIPKDFVPGVISVLYVNTEAYNPLIASAWGFQNYQEQKNYNIGNIVNLKRALIGYDASSRRALLEPGKDLAYVLEHRNKYIRLLQDYNRKVCLCIENGGKGIGFCNMNDAQIADFVRQVKDIVNSYYLDGVNLWDDDSKYGKAGMPEMNTTSYPRLIKALHEAMPDKLLTLVDKGDATEYFYDAAKCGNIEVGKYIDYAWHGYFSLNEELQIINPNADGSPQQYSKYARRLIAGLDENRYGSVTVVRNDKNYSFSFKDNSMANLKKWAEEGKKKSDLLVFGTDLIGNEYQERENSQRFTLGDYTSSFINSLSYNAFPLDPKVGQAADNGYHKDW